ncbi:hypothetical protein BDF20DRAFT_851556 [Mycotypha africana]|uniref:uncharacterized protein n=1 Tax=Mycotypha africana TaxID=64632 RepID=UPI002300FF2A|nr:uncharacterized protein BDF20DRAFT_851556 [Mycotypha africana]KAI8987668.1 hypothetical protein BDF20DRAFT_851556 [Mycotypha africana]
MSIEPDIPYTPQEDSSDSDGEWRDPSLQETPINATSINFTNFATLSYSPITSASSPLSPLNNHSASSSYIDSTATPDTSHRNADDHWVLPAYLKSADILGLKQARITEIQKASGSFIEFNPGLNQIDIWGDAEAIQKTKDYLNMIVERLQERHERFQRKTKKWGRPERELTEKERRRAEKRQAKIEEEKKYHGIPAVPQHYNASLPLPDFRLPLLRLTGENEAFWNQIRADCKAYIWYVEKGNLVRVAADTEEAVKTATTRVRNWYLRCCRTPQGATLRLLQQPKQNYVIKYRKLPPGLITYEYADPEREQNMLEKHRMLEALSTGGALPSLHLYDLINLNDDGSAALPSERAQTLDARNKEQIESALINGLESLRLIDWAIRMKIRFGQICLIDYPKKDGKFLTIEDVSEKMFKKPMFKSALAPCISKTRAGLQNLFEALGDDPNAVEFSDNPQTSFVITADQYPQAAPPRMPGQRAPPRGDMWETVMNISFTEKGQRRLWVTMTDCTNLVDVNCTNLEGNYSWDLRLQYARRLPTDDIESPHEKFADLLRVSKNNRLIMLTSSDYIPKIVTQQTKWKYDWKGYVIEICQDEIWDMNRIERPDHELPLDLSLVDPHRILFKVSLYKEAWVNRFAENLTLRIGEAPSWTLRDFLASTDENAGTIMEVAKKFSEILHKNVPLYWENSENSFL